VERLILNGKWMMKNTRDEEWICALVPGSVFNDLLTEGKIEDPFYRDNDEKALDIARFDYEYTREFALNESLLNMDKVLLKCLGLDTLSEIRINDKLVAKTSNMHRTYEFDLRNFIKHGINKIHVLFKSPVSLYSRSMMKTLYGEPLMQCKDFPISEKPIACLVGTGVQ